MDVKSLCRICLSTKPISHLENIFCKLKHEEDAKYLSMDSVITNLCKIQINENDVLPQSICKLCKKNALKATKFIKMCQESDKKLQRIVPYIEQNEISDNLLTWEKPSSRKYKIMIWRKDLQDNNLSKCSDKEESLSDIELKNIDECPEIGIQNSNDDNDINDVSEMLPSFESLENSEPISENDKHLIKLVLDISNIPPIKEDNFKCFNDLINTDDKLTNTDNLDAEESRCDAESQDTNGLLESVDILKDSSIDEPTFYRDSDFSSDDDIDLLTHKKAEEMKKRLNPFICKICGVSLCSKGSLQVHQATHSSERPFKCDKCYLTFKLKSHLVGHQRNIHEGLKKHKCNICNKSFFGSAQLKIHKMTHTKEYPHLCNHCGKRFSQQCYLRVHQKMHLGIKDLTCHHCDYTSGNQSAMRMHIKGVHEVDKKHQCTDCGLRFMYPSGLAEHMTIHTGVKKHQCTVCQRKFRTNASLKEHKRIHSDEKPYKCRFCEKSFRIVGHRTVHERIHTGEKPYICVICGKGFQTRSNLNAHQKIHNKA